MAPSQNSVQTEVYPFIDPKNFEGKLKGKTVFVTGAGGGIDPGISLYSPVGFMGTFRACSSS